MGKTGRRIWYGIAIVLCSIILLLSVGGIAGVWASQRLVSNSVSNLVDRIITVSQNIQATTQGFDQKLANMQDIVSSISQASNTLSTQVADQGLISTLLPEEKTTNLSNLSVSVQDSINNIRDMLSTIRSIYQTIDALPFINLPNLSQDQIDQLGQSVGAIQAAVDEVNSAITEFRAGASAQIDKVTSAAGQLSSRLGDVRTRLSDLNTRLTDAQNRLVQLKQTFKNALIIGSVFGSLFLLFVAYTQVEVIRLYVKRWKVAGGPAEAEFPTGQPELQQKKAEAGGSSSPADSQEDKG